MKKIILFCSLLILGACTSNPGNGPENIGGKRYIGTSLEECSRIRYTCETGETAFSDSKGCGCEPVPKPEEIFCTMEYDPVCGTVNAEEKTFPNPCFANAEKATNIRKGECASGKPDETACADIYAPVCGKIQVQCIRAPCDAVEQTFSNRCFAEQGKASDIREGACEDESKSFGETHPSS